MSWTGKKIAKLIGWFMGAIALIIIVVLIVIRIFAIDYIKANLSAQIHQKSNGLYIISFTDVKIKLLPFSVYISELELIPDENTARKTLKVSPDKIIYSFRSPEIRFDKINFKKLASGKEFYCQSLMIRQPILKLSGKNIVQKDSERLFDNLLPEIRPLFGKYINKINIKKIEFIDAHYGLSHTVADSTQFSKAEQVSVEIVNFRTDSSLIFSNNQLVETDDITIRMNNFRTDLGDSIHVVLIDTLKYSLKTSEIRASNFHLNASRSDSSQNIYDVWVPQLFMRSKSITRFAFNDSVKVQLLKFEHAKIKFYHKQHPKKFKIENLNNFDLYTLIEKDLNKIEIDSFYLSDASLEIYRQPDIEKYQQRFESVNIVLDNFTIDSVSAQNVQKLFHADDFEMKVSGYHLRLEDNQHDFKADSIVVSTFANSLGLKNIRIIPVDTGVMNLRTVVNIESSSLEIEDVDLKKLYYTRTMPTSKIEITEPDVHLQYHRERKKSNKQKEAGLLFDMVSAYLKGVYSNLVFIENGKLNIENFYNKQLQGYFETKFNFSLTDFSLDSASLKRTDKFFYATNFDLRFADYEMKLIDNLHKLDIDSIFISSINQQLKILNLNLQPVIQKVTADIIRKYDRSELYNIRVPEVDLKRINLRNAFFYNKLSISDFNILKPKIYFENFGALRASKDKKEFDELSQLIFNYIYDFDIKNISIADGQITWINHTKKGKTTSFDNEFSANLKNFKLNQEELSKNRLLFSDNFDISIKDQLFQLSDSVHILRAGEILLSTTNSSINVKNALLYPVITSKKYNKLSTTYQVSIPNLKITNFDYRKAYYTRELQLDKLDINHPKFQIYNKPGVFKSLDLKKYNFPLPAFIKSMQLGEFRINNGEVLTYEMLESSPHAVSSFKLNVFMPEITLRNNETNLAQIKSSNLVLDIFDFKSPLGKMHNVNVGRLNFNRSEKSISIQSLQVNPYFKNEKGNNFNITVPKISFTGFDIDKAFRKNNFIFTNIDITNPIVDIEINDSIRGDKLDFMQNLDLYPYTEPFVNIIQVDNLNLQNAAIGFNWFEKDPINRKINFTFKDILIAENQPPSSLLNSKEFEIKTAGLKKTDRNGFYEFTADSFIYNSARHNILFKKININPLLKSEEMYREKKFQTDVAEAKIDFIEFDGIDEKQWLTDNILVSDLLKIGKSNVSIFRNKRYLFNKNQRPPWPQDLIRKVRQPFVIDSVILEASFLKYSELLGISEDPGYVEFYDLKFNAGKISNIDKITSLNKFFKIDASAKLYNQALLNATINFDLTDNNYTHTLSGSLGEMPLTAFNKMIEKSAPVSIESGHLNRFDFNMKIDNNTAFGELYFAYDNLKISLMEYGNDEVKKAKFASFWANKMILNSENPKGKELLPETITYERDVQRSIINYWWKAIFTTAKTTIGLEDK